MLAKDSKKAQKMKEKLIKQYNLQVESMNHTLLFFCLTKYN